MLFFDGYSSYTCSSTPYFTSLLIMVVLRRLQASSFNHKRRSFSTNTAVEEKVCLVAAEHVTHRVLLHWSTVNFSRSWNLEWRYSTHVTIQTATTWILSLHVPPLFDRPNNIWWSYISWNFLFCYFLQSQGTSYFRSSKLLITLFSVYVLLVVSYGKPSSHTHTQNNR